MIRHKKQPATFVIITQARSGSYHLKSLLDSADDIVCHGEIFKRKRVELSDWHRKKLGMSPKDTLMRDADRPRYLTQLRGLNPKQIFGFKLFYAHKNPDDGLNNYLFSDNSWKKIFLYRNPLETYASLLRARKTGKWVHKTRGGGMRSAVDRVEESLIRFDATEFNKHFEKCRRNILSSIQIAEKQKNDCFWLNYKDLNDSSKWADLLAFLGSSSSADSLKSEYNKQYHSTIDSAFSNWGDVLNHLETNQLSYLLNDDCNLIKNMTRQQ